MGTYTFKVNLDGQEKHLPFRASNEEDARFLLMRQLNRAREARGQSPLMDMDVVSMTRKRSTLEERQEMGRKEFARLEAQRQEMIEQENPIMSRLRSVAGFILPASASVAEQGGEGIGQTAKQVGAGILDVGANLAGLPARGIGFLGGIGRQIARHPGILDIGVQSAIGAGQGALSGQGAGTGAATAGTLAGAFRGSTKAAQLMKEMGPEGFAKFSSELSGADPRALLAWAKGGEQRQAILSNADTQADITERILSDISNPAKINADKPEVIEALRGTIVDIQPVIEKLKAMKETPRDVNLALSPRQKDVNEKIDQIIFNLSPNGETFISGNAARIQRGEELDNLINWGDSDIDKTVAGKVESAVTAARGVYKDLLIDAARPEYKPAMERWAEKINATDRLKKMLGSSEFTREQRAQSIFDNLFGRNKESRQEILKDFDAVFGSDYKNQLENAWFAKSLGVTKERPKPSPLPTQFNGRSLLAPLILSSGGYALPEAAVPMMPLVAAGFSPQLSTYTLRGMQKMGMGTAGAGGVLGGLQMASPSIQNVIRGREFIDREE